MTSLDSCREWVELVAADRLNDALAMLWMPPGDPSRQWSPESLRRYVQNYGSWEATRDGTRWRITSPAAARIPHGQPTFARRSDVVRLADNHLAGSVDVDLPLNGEWSDLTAQFVFGPVEGGVGVSLHDLRVL